MTTGQRIKAARKNARMTQSELANRLNIPFQSISQWERDLRKPKRETLCRIANALNVSLGVLLVDPDLFDFDSRPDSGFNLADYIPPLDEIDKHPELEETVRRIRTACNNLNSVGQQEAIKRVEELTEIPRYRATSTQKARKPIPGESEGTDTTPTAPPPESP